MRPHRSAIFTVWNAGPRQMARRGELDAGRVNRALGLTLRADGPAKLAEYHTTESRCGCEDYRYRRTFCKHRIALSVLTVARELEELRS